MYYYITILFRIYRKKVNLYQLGNSKKYNLKKYDCRSCYTKYRTFVVKKIHHKKNTILIDLYNASTNYEPQTMNLILYTLRGKKKFIDTHNIYFYKLIS